MLDFFLYINMGTAFQLLDLIKIFKMAAETVQRCIIAIFSDFFYFEKKPEMRDVLAKMRETSQIAGFPARLRDG